MKTRPFTAILAGTLAWFAVGCGTMEVTTIASADHPRNLGEPVLVRVTFRDAPVRVNPGILRPSELAGLSTDTLMLADVIQ